MDKIEIRNENGVHFAYYKGLKLPNLIYSEIKQGVNPKGTHAVLTFEVELEKNNIVFEGNGRNCSDRNTSLC